MVKVDGETRLFVTIGDPVAQMRSPGVLSELLSRRGANVLVVPGHVHAADLSAFMAAVSRIANLDGLVVTVPHKIAAAAFCDRLTKRASLIGSVNLMLRDHADKWLGDNLDGVGFAEGVARQGFSIAGKSALLIGAGGAGSAIGVELLARGVDSLAVHDVDLGRRDALIARLLQHAPEKVSIGSDSAAGFDLVVNATPLGMRPDDPSPLRLDSLSSGQFVADIITKPAVSALIGHARNLGCGTMAGEAMFDAQADLLADLMLGTSTKLQSSQAFK